MCPSTEPLRLDEPVTDELFVSRPLLLEGVLELPGVLTLESGSVLNDVRVAWRLAGSPEAPVVAALGGISAGRCVYALSAAEYGWWDTVVGPGRALDAGRFSILGIDYLGGSGETTGPAAGDVCFPSISAFDQAVVLAQVLQHTGVARLRAIVGASYGGMVALAFAERFSALIERIVVISAAHRTHPMATAWRSVERRIVRHAIAAGEPAEGLKLARALAMATYRTPAEFAQRFSGPATLDSQGRLVFPVENYLFARGEAYKRQYRPEAFIVLSESIDRHQVVPERIVTPATLIAVLEDQLVPMADMRELRDRLAGEANLIELSSRFGHDAFLKETEALRTAFAALTPPEDPR